MARVLGRVRLSRFTKESTSVERQTEIITGWATVNGHEIVGWAIDTDFSRGTTPFEAPEFGQWLTDPDKVGTWDIVAVWKLDRLGAGSIILNAVLSWAQDHDKTIVSVTENLDFSTWVGRLVGNVIAGVAEGEWEAIKERTAGSQAKLRALKRWHGGTPPFGYRAVSRDPEPGWRLELNGPEAEIVREVGDRIVNGQSVNSVTRWLDTTEFRPRRGGSWAQQVVRAMMKSRWILGQKTYKGSIILDDDGFPAQYADPIFAAPEDPHEPDYRAWQAIQTALSVRSIRRTRENPTSMLLNVAKCLCGEGLYLAVTTEKGKEYRYLRCAGRTQKRTGCDLPSVRAEELERFVEEQFLSDLGDYERTERVFVPGSGNSEELERTDRAIESIRKERDLGLYEDDDEGYFSRLTALTERRKKLAAEPVTAAHWEQQGLGENYRQAWQRMGDTERRQMLVDHGITVTARSKPFEAHLHVPVETVRTKLPEFVPEYEKTP